MNRKMFSKPTKKETQAATEMQSPLPESHQIAPPPKKGAFQAMSKNSINASLVLGEASEFLKPEMLFNANYRNGNESPPFFIRRAWAFTSKSYNVPRLGIEIAFNNGKMYNVALPLNENDPKRMGVISYFDNGNAPFGPVVLVKLPTNKGNDYYDIQTYHPLNYQTAIDVPFVELEESDESLPF